MRSVNRFEDKLLQLLHNLLGGASPGGLRRFLRDGAERPNCLSADAVYLVEDALAKGCVANLASNGGWRRSRFLHQGSARSGRQWERLALSDRQLRFSSQSLELLITLTATSFGGNNPEVSPEILPNESTPANGDLLLAFLAYQRLRATSVRFAWSSCSLFHQNAFCRLMYPTDFVVDAEPACFAKSITIDCAFLWEAFQKQLVRQWTDLEHRKMQIELADQMWQMGNSQLTAANAFLAAIDSAGRRELARWMLQAAGKLLFDEVSSETWLGRLTVDGLRMADRIDAYRAALAMSQLVQRLSRWQEEARTVGYLDENYQAAQLWLSDWETLHGDSLARTSKSLLREVEPIS